MNYIDLLKEFEVKEPLPDALIEANSAPFFDLDEDISLVIPSYMAWCLKHDHSDGNLVIDGTISALSEIGRVKNTEHSYYKFKSGCSEKQTGLIIEFLEWTLLFDILNHEQIERAIKQWRKTS
ncbi:MAG TPA: hypothetical protein VIM93_11870 [Kangiella sp.]